MSIFTASILLLVSERRKWVKKKCHFAPNWHKCHFAPPPPPPGNWKVFADLEDSHQVGFLDFRFQSATLLLPPPPKVKSWQIWNFKFQLNFCTSDFKVPLYAPPTSSQEMQSCYFVTIRTCLTWGQDKCYYSVTTKHFRHYVRLFF